MRRVRPKLLVVCIVVSCLMAAGPAYAGPYFRLDTQTDWQQALDQVKIEAMTQSQWDAYMAQWSDPDTAKEGVPYPDDVFLPPEGTTGQLYVYGGGGSGGTDPCDAGLVMYWGDISDPCNIPDGNYSSAWTYNYGLDPDLSNCTITVTVTAPQFDLNGNQMNTVSLGLQDNAGPPGLIRAWHWNCGPGNPIPWNVPTQITIDTSKVGLAAATPVATGYMSAVGFSLANVLTIIVDENGGWVGGGTPAPAPGGGPIGMWNYWHYLMVSPNTTVDKGIYIKWNQPPVVVDANDPPVIWGWDEYSDYNVPPIVADDWKCEDDRPITDIHWWGSYINWNQPYPPSGGLPKSFHLGIWTDVPDSNAADPTTFSHPGTLIWENYCDNYVWNFAGYDKDPRIYDSGKAGSDPNNVDEPNDSCFQYTQLLSQDEWFYQEPSTDPCNPTIYWLSIAPIWDPCNLPQYDWGWKTRPHYFQDDAVSIQATNPAWPPPIVGVTTWQQGVPLKVPAYPDPEGISWDVAFQLTTNEPGTPSADLNNDGIVNFLDFATFADQWLTAGP